MRKDKAYGLCVTRFHDLMAEGVTGTFSGRQSFVRGTYDFRRGWGGRKR